MGVTAPQQLVKQPTETRTFSIDFSALLASGESIKSSGPAPVVTSQFAGGATTDLTIGTPAVVGNTVEFTIAGGTDCERYRIECLITTSSGQILEGDGILKVRDK